MATLARQSQPLSDRTRLRRDHQEATRRVERGDEAADAPWTAYRVTASEVEFWQAHPDRRHVRVLFTRSDIGWETTMLWP